MFTQDGYRRRTGAAADALDGLTRPPAASADSIAPAQGETDESVSASGFDAYLVKESFQRVMSNAALAMEYFYSHLFTVSPETRGMFPMGMSQMRDRLFAGLAKLVWSLDSPEESGAYLAQLGRDHRKYGVKDRHYEAFFTAMLATAAHFNGADWTPETDTAWQGALAYAARTMRSAATADARNHPPWWVGEIVGHDRRGDSVAVVTIRPDRPFPYRPGQYLTLQVTRWPRVWRAYSIANAPRSSGLIDLHVRAVPGGMVSTTLVRHAAVGDTVLLGPARGEMLLPGTAPAGRDPARHQRRQHQPRRAPRGLAEPAERPGAGEGRPARRPLRRSRPRPALRGRRDRAGPAQGDRRGGRPGAAGPRRRPAPADHPVRRRPAPAGPVRPARPSAPPGRLPRPPGHPRAVRRAGRPARPGLDQRPAARRGPRATACSRTPRPSSAAPRPWSGRPRCCWPRTCRPEQIHHDPLPDDQAAAQRGRRGRRQPTP